MHLFQITNQKRFLNTVAILGGTLLFSKGAGAQTEKVNVTAESLGISYAEATVYGSFNSLNFGTTIGRVSVIFTLPIVILIWVVGLVRFVRARKKTTPSTTGLNFPKKSLFWNIFGLIVLIFWLLFYLFIYRYIRDMVDDDRSNNWLIVLIIIGQASYAILLLVFFPKMIIRIYRLIFPNKKKDIFNAGGSFLK